LAHQALRLLQALGEEPFIFVHPQQPGDILARAVSAGSRDYLLHNLLRVTWVASLEAALRKPPLEVTCLVLEQERSEILEQHLRQNLGADVEIVRAYNPQHEYWSLAVHARGANKGDALREYYQQQGLQAEEVWAVGDGVNDVPMFTVAGRSFAMGNALPEVQAAADEILPPHTEAGVLVVLRRLMEV
jgi:hypothetical protein